MSSPRAAFKNMRYWLKARLAWVQLPIRAGVLKGKRWGVFTGSRYLRGNHGEDEVAELRQLLKPGSVFYDVGAHVGYVSLVAAQLVGPQGRVIAFEPLPLNLRFFRKHLQSNPSPNVELLPFAVSDRCGQQFFNLGGGTGRGSIGTQGIPIETVNLDALCASGRLPPPDVIKMDVEGAEILALQGAAEILRSRGPAIVLSTHGEEVKRQCETLLRSFGYQLRYYCDRDLIATRAVAAGIWAALLLGAHALQESRLDGVLALV